MARYHEFQPGRLAFEGETLAHEAGPLVFARHKKHGWRWKWANRWRRAIPKDMQNRELVDTSKFQRNRLGGAMPESQF